jgi:hypothetical protein
VANEALLRIKVVTDTAQAALGMDRAASSTSKFGSAMQKAALPAAAIGAGIIAFGKHALDAASELQQAQGAVESVFGKQADAVENLAKRSADAMGLSKSAYLNYAALVGAALQNSGFTVQESVGKSNDIMQRAADMAATYGGTTADAVEAINAAVARGEFDPLEKYAVSLNQTAIQAELAKRGQDDLTGAALKHAKAQAALDLIMKGTAKTQGQFARESDTAAGSAARASANFEDASAALGQSLLPAAAAVANALANMAKWASKNVALVTTLAAAIMTIVTAILIYNAAMKIAAIVQTAFNVAMSANVIFLVIVAIIALIAVIIIVVKNWDKITAAARKCWSFVMAIVGKAVAFIKKNWLTMIAVLLGPLAVAALVIARNWNKIKTAAKAVLDWIKSAARATAGVFKAIWNAALSAVAAYIRAWRGVISAVMGAVRSIVRGAADAMKSAFQAVRGVVSSVFGWIKSTVSSISAALRNMVPPGLGAALAAPFKTAISIIHSVESAIKGLVDWVQSLISKIASIHWPSVPSGLKSALGKLNPFSAPAPAPAPSAARGYGAWVPAPSARGVGASGLVWQGRGTGGGPTIVINGAVDPEGTARQINRILGGHERRMGLVTRS